ncbi:hypothetical protein CBS101457_003498 [Exobasidium rhododendri]|nr:hypothetical protein CBS101457_003498 [Exobasidium rhododendri]
MSTTAQLATVPPSGPRRGGRRGGGAGRFGKTNAGNATVAAAAQPDDTEEVRSLRAKYADKLSVLKELFTDWTDEDLLFALQEASGEMEVAIGRISEGHAEQFSSVKSKKQVKKETGSTVTPSTFQGASAPPAIVGASSIARGGRGGNAGARGGRGGATIRGARGSGRGGLRGGHVSRGGAAAAAATSVTDGKHVSDASHTGTSNLTPAGTTWADAVAATSSKSNGAVGGDWGDDTEGLDFKTGTAPTSKATTGNKKAETDAIEDAPAASTEEEAAAATSAPPHDEPGLVVSALAKIIPSKLVPKGSKLSWAQIARPVEPAKAVAPEPQISAPAAAATTTTTTAAAAAPAAAPAAPSSLLSSSAAADGQNGGLEKVHEPAIVETVLPTEEVRPPAPTEAVVERGESSSTLPPGLSSTVPVSEATTLEPAQASSGAAPSSTPNKPLLGRAGQSQRGKQDLPVVMAGNASQYDNLGVRFGSLNFLGAEDSEEAEESAPVHQEQSNLSNAAPVLKENGQSEVSTIAPEQAAAKYTDRFGQGTQASSTPSGQALQQEAQTTPSQQDTYASSSPYNGSKPVESYGYQQSMNSHQQVHQSAVAQAQAQHQAQHQSVGGQMESSHQQQYPTGLATVGTGAFGGALGSQGSQGQQQQQQQQQHNSQYADYYGGLDAQRLSSFYGNYDQQSAAVNARGSDDRGASQPSQQQPAGTAATDAQQQQQQQQQQQIHHQSQLSAAQQANPQQQQQYANVMPYYYPHYYLPNQFQHYGQPGAGYGQYALYGQQQQQPQQQQQQPQQPSQHPSKPITPASLHSPYLQNGPAELSGSAPYGSSSGVGSGQYGQSPATGASSLAGGGYGDGGYGRQGASHLSNANVNANDYSKLYGNSATPQSSHSSSLPGLSGFLGQTPAGGAANGSNSQVKNGSSNALENAYRQYDSGKVSSGNGATGVQPGQSSQNAHQQAGQGQQIQQQHSGQQAQQQRQQQQVNPNATPQQQQQQQYYQQYNAYAGQQQQQPSAGTGSYGNYPYRQYWG